MKNLLSILALIFAAKAFAFVPSDSAQFYFEKGMVEKNAKRYLVAANHFEKAISFNKSFTEAYIENAAVNIEMRKTDQAKANLVKAYELQPSNSKVIEALTDLYYNYRQWDKAIEFASKCTTCGNTDRIIGMSNYEKEDYVLAEKALLKAIAKKADDAQANYTLARTYMEMEAYRKAVPYFEKAVSLLPEKNNWAYELGLLYYNNNNYRSAVTAFEAALTNGYIASNDFNENYGYALLYSGNYGKGEEKLMGIYAKKNNKEIIRDLAQILYEQKQYDRSLDYCQKLLEIDAKDAKALYQAGLTFQKMGQKAKGQGMCDKAIEMDPSLASKRSKSMDPGDIGAL
ncbi:tetratricopeptide repeat protein [Ferruginibacter yonginensis]|uniref:Tetratricopeptide repeat protein n=1 Tax=Ferruginibacter yonginensis TaxID=1310416 RepID=A0ABV8QMS0_9BACT